jgi:signal transduction histidine kinase/ActR/RegA family two-component response regulator
VASPNVSQSGIHLRSAAKPFEIRIPLMWKLLAATVVSVLCFVCYLAYTLALFSDNNARLQRARDVEFPTLELVIKQVGALDKLIDELDHAVSTHERDNLTSATAIAATIRADWATLERMDPAHRSELIQLDEEFENYLFDATVLTERMLSNDVESIPEDEITTMRDALVRYKHHLNAFHEAIRQRFTETVARATSDSNHAVIGGITIAVVGLMACLIFGTAAALSVKRSVDSVVGSFREIANGDDGLNQRIPVKSHDEMGELLYWFNTFVDRLRADLDQRLAAEAELTQHRLHLEQLVRARTEELSVAKDAAESANRAKTAFLANMSHEIRTPLNAVLGFAFLLRRNSHDENANTQLDKISAAGSHLLALVDDVLDLSKIEADKLTLEDIPFRFSAVLEHVNSMMLDRAHAKGLSFHIEALDASSLPLIGDPTRLKQILLNYVGNAVKFTAAGTVTLRVLVEEDTGDDVQVRVEVEDSGVGLSPADQSRLFGVFEQADSSTTRQYGGSGLGLAINRRLATLMGGAVGVESQAGVGSKFWFTARFRKYTPELALSASRQLEMRDAAVILERDYPGLKVLLVEDNLINREIASAMMEAIGISVTTASDGLEAVNLVRERPFDIILMDMQMPEMDGISATKVIRELPNGIDVPILALTANAFAEDRQCCLDAGMNDHLRKPVQPAPLFRALLYWVEHGPAEDVL